MPHETWRENYFHTTPLKAAKDMLKEVSRRRGSRQNIKREYFSNSLKKTHGRAVAQGSFRTKNKATFHE